MHRALAVSFRGAVAIAAMAWVSLPRAAAAGDSSLDVWGSVPAPAAAPAAPAAAPPPAPLPPPPGEAGAVGHLDVLVIPESLPGDGTAANVLVHVRDRQGRLAPGNVKVLVTGGEVRNLTALGMGTFAALLVPPVGTSASSLTVTAVELTSGVSSSRAVALAPSAAPVPPHALAAPVVAPAPAAPYAPAAPAATSVWVAPTVAAVTPPRRGRVQVSYPIGNYRYVSTPCRADSGVDCLAPDAADVDPGTTTYEVVSVDASAAVPRSIGIDGEGYPIDFVGIGGGFAVQGYSTSSAVTDSDGQDATFGDDQWSVHVELRGRIALVKRRGWLDLLPRVGYHGQDALVFRYADEAASADASSWSRTVRFETHWLHGMRLGLGLRYAEPTGRVEPHVGYHATLSFTVGGVTNHHVNAGVTFRPLRWLLFDAAYDYHSRSFALEFPGADGSTQRGEVRERTHAVVLSGGLGF